MAHEHSAHGVLQGLLLPALLWSTWRPAPGWATRRTSARARRSAGSTRRRCSAGRRSTWAGTCCSATEYAEQRRELRQ
ncbi:hypothetical protein ACFQ0B_25340 [Nonomuraea thailandensis]